MRFIRYLVAWLLLLPVVLAGSGTVDDVADGRIVTIPHLREGDVYVYDLVASSFARQLDMVVESAFRVEIGHVREHTLYTGETMRVLPVTHSSGWLPTNGVLSTNRLDWPLDDLRRGSSIRTDLVDVRSGLVVERSTETIHERYTSDASSYRLHRDEEASVQLGLERASPFFSSLRPGQPVRSPAEAFVRHLGDTFGAGASDRVDGVVNGTFVTRVEEAEPHTFTAPVKRVQCEVWQPEIHYTDDEVWEFTHNRSVVYEKQRQTWVSGIHALPVLQDCRLRLNQADDPSVVVEDLRLATVLTGYERGTSAVDIEMAPWGRATAKGPHADVAVPVEVAGLVPTHGADLVYPLEEALADVRSANDASELGRWNAESSNTWYIREATYTPQPSEAPADSTVPGVLPSLPLEPPPYAEPEYSAYGWKFWLYDTGAGSIIATASRQIDAQGRIVETSVGDGARVGAASEYFEPSGPPENAIPLHELLILYGEDAGIEDPLAWVEKSEGGFTIESFNLGDGSYRIGFPQSPRLHNHRNEGIQYRTSDGLIVERWERSRSNEEVAGPPPASHQTVADAASVIPEVGSAYAATVGVSLLTMCALLLYFWDVILRLLVHWLGFPLYAKVTRDEALENPKREEIHELVQAEPGLTVAEIRTRLALGHGTVMFHLATLERVGILSSVRVGRARQWFAPGQVDHSAREQTAVLRHAAVRRVHEAVLAEPGVHQRALADRLGIRPASLRPHLARLASVGLLRIESEGQTRRYHAVSPRAERPASPEWRPVESAA